jgi:hypothetical protein
MMWMGVINRLAGIVPWRPCQSVGRRRGASRRALVIASTWWARKCFKGKHAFQLLAIVVMTGIPPSCTRPARAGEYRPGTELKVVISEVGTPDIDRPYPQHQRDQLCPPVTVRLVEYHRRPLFGLRFLDEGGMTLICVDKTEHIVQVLSSGL